MLRVDNINLYYGAAQALRGVSISAEPGKVTCVLGRNGVGKTSLLRAMVGQYPIASGSISFDGTEISGLKPYERARRGIGFVPQGREIFPLLTVEENLKTGFGPLKREDRNIPDDVFSLFPVLQTMLGRRGGDLSGGQQQQLAIGRALVMRPKLLLLDEPTGGLDPLMEVAFRECIREARERGQTVFLSSHILSEVEALCDRIGILREGRLVDQGTLEELRHLAAQTVEVTFAAQAPEIPPLPGVTASSAGPNALRFEVSGSVGPLIAALAGHPVETLTSREPSLEEIFLHHYDGSGGRAG